MPSDDAHPFLGLAPFLRTSLAGGDLRGIAQVLLAETEHDPDNAARWMNLSTAFYTLRETRLAQAMQDQALQLTRLYSLPARTQPARLTLLVLAAPGELSDNTPLDCLTDGGDVDLVYWYARQDAPLPWPLPAHDAVFVAIGDAPANRPLLTTLDSLLALHPRPVLNAPAHIPRTDRAAAAALLQNAPGLAMPPTLCGARAALEAIATGRLLPGDVFAGCAFPLIVRPQGSQAGRDLARITGPDELTAYLAGVDATDFFVSNFVDYRSTDGLYRKYRVVLIDGVPYGCHMGISSHWMVHYLNAGMYEDAAKRAEEAAWLAGFEAFAERHRNALTALFQRIGLDYLCVDCAETRDGRLLVFETDHVMVVHAMDPLELFPYKPAAVERIRNAFVAAVERRTAEIAA